MAKSKQKAQKAKSKTVAEREHPHIKKFERELVHVKPIHLLMQTIKVMRADQIVTGWILILVASVFLLHWYNPGEFPTLQDSAWYVFETVSTIGYGDFVANTLFGRIVTVVIGFSSLFVLAILTGVVVNYYTQRLQVAQNNSFMAFGQKMEHLTELDQDELKQLEDQFREYMHQRKYD